MGQASERFNLLDTDHSGYLEKDELLSMAEWLLTSYEKYGFSEDERRQIMLKLVARIDSNSDGVLDLYEFSQLFEHATTKILQMNNARGMFNELDVLKQGYLDIPQIQILAEKLILMHDIHNDGSIVSLQEKESMTEKIMKMFYSISNGKIDLYSFSHVYDALSSQMSMCKRARDKFNEIDVSGTGMLTTKELEVVIGK